MAERVPVGLDLDVRAPALKPSAIVAGGWYLLIGAAALAGFAVAVEGAPVIAWTPRFVASLAFLSVVGTAAAVVIWFEEALRSPLATLTAWTYLAPLFGIGFGAILLGERLTSWTLAGLVVVLVGLAVGLKPERDR